MRRKLKTNLSSSVRRKAKSDGGILKVVGRGVAFYAYDGAGMGCWTNNSLIEEGELSHLSREWSPNTSSENVKWAKIGSRRDESRQGRNVLGVRRCMACL